MKKIILFVALGFLGSLIFYKSKTFQKPYLTVAGFVRMADGLGRQCPEMIDALKDDLNIGFYPLAESRLQDVPQSILPIIKKPNKELGTVVFLNDNPWRPCKRKKPYGAMRLFPTTKIPDQIRICYTMLESTAIPKQWVDILNNYFDLVAVPDPFLIDVFVSSGVKIPVFTLPLGLHLDEFLKQPLKSSYNSVFRFGTLGALNDRKNQIKLIHAFTLAFEKNPNIELLIHSRRVDRDYKDQFLEELKKLNNPMIHFSESVLDQKSYLKLFQSLDVLVNVSKGEGFSIQPREAMSLGIPCLITNNTAQASVVKNANVISLESSLREPCYYNNLKQVVGDSFNFELTDLVQLLKETYDHRDAWLHSSASNRNYAKNFDYQVVKGSYRNLIKPKKVLKGECNLITDDGFITTSDELIEKYQRLTGAE